MKNSTELPTQNLYIHFPFCRRKCTYCALHSRAGSTPEARAAYVARLAEAIRSWKVSRSESSSYNPNTQTPKNQKTQKPPFRTIYFGGGSPALCDLRPIFEALAPYIAPHSPSLIPHSSSTEFTVELHPLDVTRETLQMLKDGGVNRISMGLQSLDDDVLQHMGRGYTFDEAERAFMLIKEYFDNAGIDLIVGYPEIRVGGLSGSGDEGESAESLNPNTQTPPNPNTQITQTPATPPPSPNSNTQTLKHSNTASPDSNTQTLKHPNTSPRWARLAKWGIRHCSVYSLILEEKSILFKQLQRGLSPEKLESSTSQPSTSPNPTTMNRVSGVLGSEVSGVSGKGTEGTEKAEGTQPPSTALKPKYPNTQTLKQSNTSLWGQSPIFLPSDDEVLNKIATISRFLKDIGLERYEISNYAVPGYECRHNLATWRGEDYIGLGDGAHGRIGLLRTQNCWGLSPNSNTQTLKHSNTSSWGMSPNSNTQTPQTPQNSKTSPWGQSPTLETVSSEKDGIERKIFALRTREGMDIAGHSEWEAILDRFVYEGLLVKIPGDSPRKDSGDSPRKDSGDSPRKDSGDSPRYRLTERGTEVCDSILAELV